MTEKEYYHKIFDEKIQKEIITQRNNKYVHRI